MKKSLLLLASFVMSVATFAQWTAPAPRTVQDAITDGVTSQYLYNKEAGGFFAGGNDWNTRASVTTVADPIRFVSTEDGDNMNFQCYPQAAEKNAWLYVSCNAYDAQWVDAGSAVASDAYPGTDAWQIVKQANGSYKIYNTDYDQTKSYSLGVAEIFAGKKGNTRTYIHDVTQTYDVNEEAVPIFEGAFYDEWYFIDEAEFEYLKPLVETYLAALSLGTRLDAAKELDATRKNTVAQGVYTNYSSTTEELQAAEAIVNAAISFFNAYTEDVKNYPNLNFSAPKAVYDNENSTAEELQAAESALQEIINNYLSANASFDTPVDYTDVIGDGSSVEPWTQTFTGEGTVGSHTTNTWSTEANGGADGTDMVTPFIEHWTGSGGILSDQKIYQTFKGAAPGLYKFTANVRAYSEAGGIDTFEGLTMYFGDEVLDLQAETPMFKSGSKCVLWKDGGFSIIAIVKETADIEFGFNIKDANFNWLAFKGTSLKYYGNENVEENAILLKKGDNVYEPFEGKANADVVAAYNAAAEKYNAAKTAEELEEALAEMRDANAALEASKKAYNSYIAKVTEIRDYLVDNELVCEEGDIISDYIMEDNIEEPSEVNPCGTADYILDLCELTDEQIAEETARIDHLFKLAIANSLYEGKDCTDLLADADFSDANGNGWTVGKLGAPGAWTGGLIPGLPVCEAWHKTFDIYQEVEVPNGIYAVSLNGFVRRDSGAEVEAEVYMNDFATKFMDIQQGGIPMDDNAIDGFNCYLTNGTSSAALTQNPIFEGSHRQSPNDATDTTTDGLYAPNGMEGASVAFSAGRYEAVAYGLVENGKIRLGVRNTRNDDWCLWGNFKLTYMGKDLEALQSILPLYVEKLETYNEENEDNITAPVAQEINAALSKAADAYDEDEHFEALVAVNAAIVAAQENVAAVEALRNKIDELGTAIDSDDANPNGVELFNKIVDDIDESNFMQLSTEGIAELTAKVEEVLAAVIEPMWENASDETPVDATAKIVNPDFQMDGAGAQATGWTLVKGEGASGNYQVQNGFDGGVSMEFWSNTNGSGTKYDFYQRITGLPAGTYTIYADAANSLNDQTAGPGEGAAYIYAAGANGTDIHYACTPIEVQAAGCADSYNNYEVTIKLAEGEDLIIGSKNIDELSARWVMIDNFRLEYYGANSTKEETSGEVSVQGIQTATAASAIYTISGTRVDALQKGINIVRMSNGTVKKVLVK